MSWLANNWIIVIAGIAFVAFHFFGHRGHGGHGSGNSHGSRTGHAGHGCATSAAPPADAPEPAPQKLTEVPNTPEQQPPPPPAGRGHTH